MNAAAKELPVSYDLSKPQEDREPYVGSVLFFKHVIFTVTLLLIQMGAGILIYGGLSAGYLCLTKDPFLNDVRNRLNKILKKKK